jgi:hypothetical protein
MEENLRMTNCVLSRTQALLLKERNNCQQMALHIDLLKVNLTLNYEKYVSIKLFFRNNMNWIVTN